MNILMIILFALIGVLVIYIATYMGTVYFATNKEDTDGIIACNDCEYNSKGKCINLHSLDTAIDYVRGTKKKFNYSCDWMRLDNRLCGKKARYFEGKK